MPEIGTADSLVAIAQAKKQEGKGREGYWVSACAAAYYRLAIQKHELELSRKEVAELKKDLAAAQREVRTYGEVVRELENMRKP
jgi:phage terminase Nu1 subunit (DNA packaging protein)